LKDFFREAKAIPEDLKPYKIIFSGFDSLSTATTSDKHSSPKLWKYVIAAAVFIGVVFTAAHFSKPYCYIDGRPIYNLAEAKMAGEDLKDLEKLDEAMSSIENILNNSSNENK